MLKIRLQRRGRIHYGTYRIVVANAQDKRDGKFLDDLGYYNPLIKPIKVEINKEKYNEWIKKGAQPNKSVESLYRLINKKDLDQYLNKRVTKKNLANKRRKEAQNKTENENTTT